MWDEMPYDCSDDLYDAMQDPEKYIKPKRKQKMAQCEGIVTYVGYKKLPNAKSPVWSFAIGDNDDRVYYRTGFKKPVRQGEEQIEVGDEIKFEFNVTQYGNEVNMDRFKVLKVGPGKVDKPAYKAKGGGGKVDYAAKDKYWADKDKYDKEVTAPLYNYRFSLATAKDLVIEAKKLELLPKAKTKGAEMDLLVSQIALMGEEIFALVNAKKESFLNPVVEETPEPAAPAEDNFDDEWDD